MLEDRNRNKFWAVLAIAVCLTFSFVVAHTAEWSYSGRGLVPGQVASSLDEFSIFEITISGEPNAATMLATIKITNPVLKSVDVNKGTYGARTGSIRTNSWDARWDENRQGFIVVSVRSTSGEASIICKGPNPPPRVTPPGVEPPKETGSFFGTWVNNENGGSTVVINADGTGSMTFHTGTRWRKADTPYHFKWVMEEARLVYSYNSREDPHRGMMPGKKIFKLSGNGIMINNSAEPQTYYKK